MSVRINKKLYTTFHGVNVRHGIAVDGTQIVNSTGEFTVATGPTGQTGPTGATGSAYELGTGESGQFLGWNVTDGGPEWKDLPE